MNPLDDVHIHVPLQAVAAIVKAAHGQALTTDEHTALGVALADAVAPKA